MYTGQAAQVAKIMAGLLDRSRPLTAPEVERLSFMGGYNNSGLQEAINNGRTAAVIRYASAILQASPDVLPAPLKKQWLNVDALFHAFTGGAPTDTVAEFVRLLACAPTLERQTRLELLLESRRPVLHKVASLSLEGEEMLDPGLPNARHELLYVCMREFVASTMPTEDVALLCASRYDSGTGATSAAQAALANGNPRAAAAMLSAIVDTERDAARRATLLASLGVDVHEVVAELAKSGSRCDALWIARLRESITKAGLPWPSFPPSALLWRRSPSQAAPPSPVDTLCAELERMIPAHWAQSPARAKMLAAQAADAILDCMREAAFDFSALKHIAYRELAAALSSTAVAALQAYAATHAQQA